MQGWAVYWKEILQFMHIKHLIKLSLFQTRKYILYAWLICFFFFFTTNYFIFSEYKNIWGSINCLIDPQLWDLGGFLFFESFCSLLSSNSFSYFFFYFNTSSTSVLCFDSHFFYSHFSLSIYLVRSDKHLLVLFYLIPCLTFLYTDQWMSFCWQNITISNATMIVINLIVMKRNDFLYTIQLWKSKYNFDGCRNLFNWHLTLITHFFQFFLYECLNYHIFNW